MTGYGEATGRTGAGMLRIELRTVNHRYLNVNTRLPGALARWEGEIANWLRSHLRRGHVNCVARWEPDETAPAGGLRLDEEKAAGYIALFHDLAEKFDLPGTPDLSLLSRFGDIIVRDADVTGEVEVTAEELRAIVEDAARHVVQMRIEEGRRLAEDFRDRLDAIDAALTRIEAVAPERLERERNRLTEAVAELASGVQIDEQRLAQEIALIAERWDINEELVRFRSHDVLFRELIGGNGEEPVGKRLSFLVQEMHREANTIGSKANDARIAHLVVSIKDELERIREQAENVE